MPDDFLATTQTTGRVQAGHSTRGEIESANDHDWFAVELEAGRTYRINLKGVPTTNGTLVNPYLYGIHDENGEILAGTTNDNGGRGADSRVFFTATETGTYYVAAGAAGNWTGTYRLEVADITHTFTDDFATGTGTSGTVAVDGSTRGAIDQKGDRDWFAVELVEGRDYRIDLLGTWYGHGTLSDPYLYGVHNPAGDLIAGTTNDDGGAGYNSRLRFTAEETGTHYVAAGAYGAGRGTYRLTVKLVDDYPETAQTTGRVLVGESARGTTGYEDDVDWFAVRLVAGRTYRIDLEGADTGAGTLANPYLRGIHDADGNLIAGTTDDDGGTDFNSRVTFTAEEGGTYRTYYVAAAAAGDLVGTYRLSVADVTDTFTDDYAAGVETTGTVTEGGSVTGVIGYEGDIDWFAVRLEPQQEYRIDIEGHARERGPRFDPRLLGLYNADGDLVADTTDDNRGVNGNSRRAFFHVDSQPGTYYVAVGGEGGSEGTYTLSVHGEDILDDFPEESVLTTGRVEVGGSVSGRVDFRGDRDWFDVELEGLTTYRIDLVGSGITPVRNPYLYGIYRSGSSEPFAGTTNDDGGAGLNSRVYFTPGHSSSARNFYVVVGATGSVDAEGDYRLSVTEVSEVPDDFANASELFSSQSHGLVAVGGLARGDIEVPHDRDVFQVWLEAGRHYRIDLKGADTFDGTLQDPYLRGIFFGPDRDRVAGTTTNDDGGVDRNSRLYFTAEETGFYDVEAGAHRDHTGTYTLSVTDLGDFAAGTDTTGVVVAGGDPVRSNIDVRGDRDWFAVELAADTGYRIDLEGRANRAGTLRDPYIYGVHDAQGNLIDFTTDDDSGAGYDSRVYVAVSDAGTYYVAAGAFGSGQGSYRLTVTEVLDDFSANADTTGSVTVGGSVTGRVETPDDVDWFEVDLEAGVIYHFFLAGHHTDRERSSALGDPYLRGIFDSNGDRIAGTTNDDVDSSHFKFDELHSTLDSWVQFTPSQSGTYYVEARASDGTFDMEQTTSVIGTYKLSVEEPPDDYSASTDTSGVVQVGGSADGRSDYIGDRDWFAVELVEGSDYRIDLKMVLNDEGVSDPYIYGVHKSDGTIIPNTTDSDSGVLTNARLLFTATETGTHYVAAGAEPSGFFDHTAIGTYTLEVEVM